MRKCELSKTIGQTKQFTGSSTSNNRKNPSSPNKQTQVHQSTNQPTVASQFCRHGSSVRKKHHHLDRRTPQAAATHTHTHTHFFDKVAPTSIHTNTSLQKNRIHHDKKKNNIHDAVSSL